MSGYNSIDSEQEDAIRHHADVVRTASFDLEACRWYHQLQELQKLFCSQKIDTIIQDELQSAPDTIRALGEFYSRCNSTTYNTQMKRPFVWNHLAEQSDFGSPELRKILFSKDGFLNQGFPSEGPVQQYGVWNNAKNMSATEISRLAACPTQQEDIQQALKKASEKMALYFITPSSCFFTFWRNQKRIFFNIKITWDLAPLD